MNKSYFACAFLLLISIISPSCDSKTQQAPAEQPKTKDSSLEQAPKEQAPAKEMPAEEVSTEQAPAEEATAEETTTEEASAEETPAEEMPADQITTLQSDQGNPLKNAQLEYLKYLQDSMNSAMEKKDFEKASNLAKTIQKIVAEMDSKKSEESHDEMTNSQEGSDESPVAAQQGERVAEAPAADESTQPAATGVSNSIYESQIARLVKLRDSEKAQALVPVQKRFDLAAQQLLRKVMQIGNLDAANRIKASIENLPDLATLREEAQTPLDRDLLRLVEQREKESAIATAPAQKRFDLAAQQLIRKETQAGNLQAANEIKSIIEEAAGSLSSSPVSAPKTTSVSPNHSLSGSTSKIGESPEKDFEVTFQGETAQIAKYVGKSDKVRVPTMIQGVTVTSIGREAFSKNEKIKEVVLPETIQAIFGAAFNGCKSLTKINIPKSVGILDGNQFGCPVLKELKIPASVRSIGGNLSFGCFNLEKIEVDPVNEYFASVDGVLYDKQITTLMNAPAGLKIQSLKVPRTVNKINRCAFRGCKNLKTLQIPQDAVVEEDAFRDANIRVIRY